MEENKDLNTNDSNDSLKDQEIKSTVNQEKPHPVRNFFKELKRVTWPTEKKNYKYFFWVFVFIIFLIAFFALISWGATELWKAIGAN